MTDSKILLKMLREELTLQTRHCKLLEAQQRALLACDRPRFCDMQVDHAQILASLDAHKSAWQSVLLDTDGNAVSVTALLTVFSEREQRPIIVLRDTLKQTLEQVQTLTRQNQQLIQNELNYIAFSLDLFVEAGRKSMTGYGGSAYHGRLFLDRCA